MILHVGFGCIIIKDLRSVPNIEQYMITSASLP
jgi:hypothetical protein